MILRDLIYNCLYCGGGGSEILWLLHTFAVKCAWVSHMRKSNNLPKARMTAYIGLMASIVTFLVDSSWYTPGTM